MKIAKIMLVASLGAWMGMQAHADGTTALPDTFSNFELADATEASVAPQSVSLSCGFQGKLDSKEAKAMTQEEMSAMLAKAGAACEAVMNTVAAEEYHAKAEACSQSKENCLPDDMKALQQSWCGYMHIHPVHAEHPMPIHWAENMDKLIEKAKKACLASTDETELEAATTYFEAYTPKLCSSTHKTDGAVQSAPEACVSMYHAIGMHGAPY